MAAESPRPLELLDPSPVDETALGSDKDYFPPQPPLRSSHLGLSSHSSPYYLLRIHRYTSYAFTLFAAAHITNTSLLPLLTRSARASSPYLLLTRPYYQSWPLAEPLLVIAPLLLHVASGLALRLHRRRALLSHYADGRDTSRADRRRIPWPKLSGTSALGYAGVPLLAVHVAVNRVLPWLVEGGSSGIGLEYVGHGFAVQRALSAVAYGGLVVVVGAHVVWGWAKWLGLTPEQVEGEGRVGASRRRWRWWVVNGVSACVVGLWMAGGLGVVARSGKVEGWVGMWYDDLYRRVPILGRWV